MSSLPDPIRDGLAKGWKVFGPEHRPLPTALTCDVAIVGTGAGAGMTAELLSSAGLSVVLIEEGPLRSSKDFRQMESDAYPQLYQESAGRKTADKAIALLQGRAVGGSTLINWTTALRADDHVFKHWGTHFGLSMLNAAEMSAWYGLVERRLKVAPWEIAPNANNDLLRIGCEKLGHSFARTPRNVSGCYNLGSCGMGCPTNAKQSALINLIAPTLDRGATLLVQTRVERLVIENGEVHGVDCVPVLMNSERAPGAGLRVTARHVVVAGGALNSPALLMRSQAPDPYSVLGKRTHLHPNLISAATYSQPVEGWSGAPQTVYSSHFANYAQIDGPMGFKLDAAPMHPTLMFSTFAGFGAQLTHVGKTYPNTQAMICMLRDGFHPDSPTGSVSLRDDGSPVLEYKLNPFFWEGAQRALLAMAETQFAAGALSVTPVHENAGNYSSWKEAREAILALPMVPYKTRVSTAHQMGGCAIAAKPELGVVDPNGRHWQLKNLSIHDGSLFPTSLGTNPQLTVYALVCKLAAQLTKDLSGKAVALSIPA